MMEIREPKEFSGVVASPCEHLEGNKFVRCARISNQIHLPDFHHPLIPLSPFRPFAHDERVS